MKRAISGGRLGGGLVLLLAGSACLLPVTSACGDERGGFGAEGTFEVDSGTSEEKACFYQCSLDGRAVIDSCTGATLEECPEHLACGGARCLEPCAAAAEDRSSNGCEFFFQQPRFAPRPPQSCHAAFVVNTSNQPVELGLEYAGRKLDISNAVYQTSSGSADLRKLEGPLPPGESAILFVSDRDPEKHTDPASKIQYIACPHGVTPAVSEDIDQYGATLGRAFRLTSNVPVSVTSMYPYGGAASYVPTASLVLPVSAWAKEHIVVNGWDGTLVPPIAQVYAAEDDTEVTVTGSVTMADGSGYRGAPAGESFTVKLQKGELLQLSQSEEFTGSIIRSTKPTITVGGNTCPFVPSQASACDTLAQFIPPFEQWGSEYPAVSYRPRVDGREEENWYRLVGARDGTELSYDPEKPPGAPTVINAGQLAIFRARSDQPFVVRSRDAEHPFYLGIHMTGGDPSDESPGYGGQGDPDFVNVVAAGQFRNAYSFFADTTYPEHSLVIVREKVRDRFEDVHLECLGKVEGFTPLGSDGRFEYRRVDLSRRFGPGEGGCHTGLHRMTSAGPFSATLWGWGAYASYGYPGGTAIRKLVETPLVPVQ